MVKWHDTAAAFIKKGFRIAYPNHKGKKDELPTIYNDHDWSSEATLIRADAEDRRKEVKALRDAFENECRRDPEDDKDGFGGDAFQVNFWSRFKRGRRCGLCPTGFSPRVRAYRTSY